MHNEDRAQTPALARVIHATTPHALLTGMSAAVPMSTDATAGRQG